MANKVPCGGFTIGDNMQIVDGELSSKVVGGYTSSDVWRGHLYNNTSTDDKQLYDMLVNHVGDTAMVTFIKNTGGKVSTVTDGHKIEAKSFGIGFFFEGGVFYVNADTEMVELADTSIVEVIEVRVENDVKIPSRYLDIDGGDGNYLPLTGGTLSKSGNGNVLTITNTNGVNTLQIKDTIYEDDLATLDAFGTHVVAGRNGHDARIEIRNDQGEVVCGFVNNIDSFGTTNSYLVLTTNNTRYKITVDSDGTLKTQGMK